jgi:hypothetical protein
MEYNWYKLCKSACRYAEQPFGPSLLNYRYKSGYGEGDSEKK